MRTNVKFIEIPKLLYMDRCMVRLPEWHYYVYVDDTGCLRYAVEGNTLFDVQKFWMYSYRDDWTVEMAARTQTVCEPAKLYKVNEVFIAARNPEEALETFYPLRKTFESLKNLSVISNDLIIDHRLYKEETFVVDDPNDTPNECRREDAGHVPDTLLFDESE